MVNRTEKDIQYHNAVGHEYDAVVVKPRAYPNQLLFESVNPLVRVGDGMLDVGCGTGHMILRYGHRFRYVIGVDHSQGMINAARKEVKRAAVGRVNFECVDISDYLQSETRKFDLVTCVGCLHHQDRREIPRVIMGLAARVKPGGLLVIADPIEVDLSAVPKRVLEWNRKSIAATIGYSNSVEEPDEAPIPLMLLTDGLKDAQMRVVVTERGWDILPRKLPPGLWEKVAIRRLHKRFGASGNVILIAAVPAVAPN